MKCDSVFFPLSFFFLNVQLEYILDILVCWKRRIIQAFNPRIGLFHHSAVQAGCLGAFQFNCEL